MDKIWYFGAEDSACDDCQSASGFYTTKPARPHPGCGCSIEEFSVDDSGVNKTVELRNVSVATSTDPGLSITYDINNCEGEALTISFESSIDVEDNLGSDLKSAMESNAGWTPPGHVDEIDSEVPVDSRGSIEVSYVIAETTGTAERWIVYEHEEGKLRVERKLDELSGTYTFVKSMTAIGYMEKCTPVE